MRQHSGLYFFEKYSHKWLHRYITVIASQMNIEYVFKMRYNSENLKMFKTLTPGKEYRFTYDRENILRYITDMSYLQNK